ncbi:MAG: hypothetical protein Fur0015_06740 [Ignavibacteriales bacterium]
MTIKLIVSDDCEACKRAEKIIHSLSLDSKDVKIETVNINKYEDKKIIITPALLIDDKLFSYGDINENKLQKVLKEKNAVY